ncbi:protein-tyrosine-phosphatase [Flavobacteriales bacterium 34_180_T64]|mgnify:CR=1 FL=1|nr:protein-tyrosine-phosphatase [Flavobacteriales bacterium 34_180_T64]
MTKILMVCLGNICRSPLAHGILESLLPDTEYYVDSAGTANYHIGESPDHRSIEVAKLNNIDISGQSARQFKISDFDTFDIIYAMDTSNYDDITKLARNSSDKSKIKLILDANEGHSNQNVPDPYYGDFSNFETVFNLLNTSCQIIAGQLKQ